MKCSKRMCPMQYNISDDCDIKDCPYRTEDVEPQEAIKALCNYIGCSEIKRKRGIRND